ncbi:MAG: MarR family transcriptional regulator [Candidatus Hydrogenedentota bacterium]|nr:MAG: MarR family transcriptional regulator [Candidatus Hydrogenedentota bacterium]
MTQVCSRDTPTREKIARITAAFPSLDPDALFSYVALIHTAATRIAEDERFLARYGLTQGRFWILLHLYQAVLAGEKGVNPSELASRSNVSRATITGLIDHLIRDGQVQRVRSEIDRRRLIVTPTRKGLRLIRKIVPAHGGRISRLMRALTPREQKTLVRLLEKISQSAAALADNKPPRKSLRR